MPEPNTLIGRELWLNRHVRGWGRVKILEVCDCRSGSCEMVRVADLQDGDNYPALLSSLKERLTSREQREADQQPKVDLESIKHQLLEAAQHVGELAIKIHELQ